MGIIWNLFKVTAVGAGLVYGINYCSGLPQEKKLDSVSKLEGIVETIEDKHIISKGVGIGKDLLQKYVIDRYENDNEQQQAKRYSQQRN